MLYLGLARYDEAFDAATLLHAQEAVAALGASLPSLVEAGARSGHAKEAETALAELRKRAVHSQTHWARGLFSRSAALLADEATAEPLYVDAIHHLGETVVPIELARAQLLYGEWLRRQNRPTDTRDHLRTAHSMFNAIGAVAFAGRARTELAASGETVPWHTPTARRLTSQEAQISRLAADGATNQEIATQLFLSVNTVEYHLKKTFRKLGVTSRRRLKDHLDDAPVALGGA